MDDMKTDDLVTTVRNRPAMYVGSTAIFGFINYLVYPFVIILGREARLVEVIIEDGLIELRGDVALDVKITPDGKVMPFEETTASGFGHGIEAPTLNALSERLLVEICQEGTRHIWHFKQGRPTGHEVSAASSAEVLTRLQFTPDATIFLDTDVSLTVFESFLNRISHFYPHTLFRLVCGNVTREFQATNGLRGMFDAICVPYQIMHEPVHITAEEGKLRLELIFAFQNWRADRLWCFINKGRTIDGGTHESGLQDAFRKIYFALGLAEKDESARNGVIALLSLIYPNATWEGCIKSKIVNPELRQMVKRLVVAKTLAWFEKHPEAARQVRQMQLFQFPEVWYS